LAEAAAAAAVIFRLYQVIDGFGRACQTPNFFNRIARESNMKLKHVTHILFRDLLRTG
jgi:hypothetical protein